MTFAPSRIILVVKSVVTKNEINGNVREPHTEGKKCDKRQYY